MSTTLLPHVTSGVLAATLLLPIGGAVVAAVLNSARAATAARVGTAAAVTSAAAAVVLMARVATSGPVSAVWTGADGRPLIGVALDRLTAVLLLLVCAVSAVVQGFAGRYLAGDRRLRWFIIGTGVLTAASAGVVSAVTLLGLAGCWSVAGLGLWLLLGTYPDLAAARDGQRRAAFAFLTGDAALWVAVAVVTTRWGNLDLRQLDARALPGAAGLLPGLGCLVVLAALSRSAQFPFHRWLPATLAAPTPVSALLHAGVVNAGGVLLIRLAPLASSSRLALGLAVTAGAVTTGYGTVLMLTKADVKGALAHSTMGQMGFLIMTCGLGLYTAALIHLVLHGLYKATLFLASGSAIRRHVAQVSAPPPPRLSVVTRSAVVATSLIVPGVALWVVLHVPNLTAQGPAGAGALMVFAWTAASAAALGWLRRQPSPFGYLVAAAAAVVTLTGYVALIAAADRFLAPAVPIDEVSLPATGGLVVVLLGLLGLLAALARPGMSRNEGRFGRLHRRLYVLALTAGHVNMPRLAPLMAAPDSARPPWPSTSRATHPVQVAS